MTKYLLDANVFMTASDSHYDFDVCPAFWDWLAVQNTAGKVFSIARVKQELVAKQVRVSRWAQSLGSEFFLDPSEDWQPALDQVATWVRSQNYQRSSVEKFLKMEETSPADYYLIAHALHGGFLVVTHEVRANSPTKIKIPNVCDGVSVKVISPYQMLRAEKARFVLDTGK
ncbi:MAG: DUF4411 family protein [Pirellulales bacterium]|nr:DUF4411 family protein [Alphaproteobacteria bacterium]MDA8041323.1 DUF4411 family protein [Pirellulales bacterium]